MKESDFLTKKERQEWKKAKKEEKNALTRKRRLLERLAFWLIILSGVGLAAWGVVGFGHSRGQGAVLADAVSDLDQTKGSSDFPITLVEYSDFQCPACAYFFALTKEFEKEFGKNVRFVYRHFPLRRIHSQAQLAAQAAEAAGKQGRFWEMHDVLFEKQGEWAGQSRAEEFFISYASQMGLDTEQFANDLYSDEIIKKVENDYQSALRSNIKATPTFFVNGKQIEPAESYEEFKDLVIRAAGAI